MKLLKYQMKKRKMHNVSLLKMVEDCYKTFLTFSSCNPNTERGVKIMAKRRSTKEQLDELISKQEEMKAKEKSLKKKLALEERKARTRRLIGVGAEVESVYGKPITKEMLPLLRKFLLDQESRGNFLTKALEKEADANEK